MPESAPHSQAAQLLVELAVRSEPPSQQRSMVLALLANVAGALVFLDDEQTAAEELYRLADRLTTRRRPAHG